MAADGDTKALNSVHEDPNFAVICSFISRYGTLLGLPDISFDELEKWIDDTRKSTFTTLAARLPLSSLISPGTVAWFVLFVCFQTILYADLK